jgi:hypothetical protein
MKEKQGYFFEIISIPEDVLLVLNGGKIPFVNNVKYYGFVFDRRMTWRLHIESAQ